MATSIGPKIGVDGEAEYRAQMTRLISQTKALKAEEEALKTAVGDEATEQNNARKAAQKHAEQIELQKQKVELLESQLQKCITATGSSSTETDRYREALAKAKTELNRLENQTDEGTEALDDFSGAEEDAGDGALTLGDMISANLISEAIIGGLKMLANLAKEAAEALMGAARDAAEYADEVLTMSTVTGLSTDQIQEFQYMAELVDVSLDTMTGSMTKLTRTMVSARKGGEGATQAFQQLGIRTTNADGSLRNVNDVFFEAIDALGQMEDGTERDALAMELFGKSAKELNPLIAAGKDSIEAFREEAHAMGYVLDDETLGRLGNLDDSFVRLGNLRTMLSNKVGAAMAPALERVINKLIEFADRVDWDKIGAGLGRLLETGADKLIELLDGLDFDKLASGAVTLLDGLVSGLTWILEHADEIVALVSQIGGMLLIGKGVGAAKSGWGMLSSLFSGGAKAGGAADGATGATGATGPSVSGNVALLNGALTWLGRGLLVKSVVDAGIGTMDYLANDYATNPEAILGEWGAVATEVRNVGQAFEDMNNTLLSLDPYGENAEIVDEWTQAIENYRNGLLSMTEGTASDSAVRYLNDNIDAILSAFTEHAVGRAGAGADAEAYKALTNQLATVSAEYLNMQGSAESAAQSVHDSTETTLGGMASEASGWGSDMMASMADGVAAGANSSLIPTITSVAAAIAALLHHSEPDVGPLANDSEWMPDLMSSMAEGIRANKGLVLGEMNALAADMGALMPTGGGTTMNCGGVTVVFQVQDGQDGRALFEQFSDWLAQSVYREGADLA